MASVTAWVKSAPVVTGQDHLGTIAPAESIYGVQLPGITNVTARARYYSFYPWLFRELEARKPKTNADDFVNYLRRAECLFALAAIRHSRVRNEAEVLHGAAMVGREKLVPAVEGNSKIALGDHASLDSKQRYFMNALGGLGQYYFGPLRELGILGGDTRTRDLKYTEERGRPLAEAFAKGVDAASFFALLDDDEVALSDLDDLAAFCPCALAKNVGERRALLDLLVDPQNKLGDEGAPRRGTLALVLDLASKKAAPEYDFTGEFRASTYAGALFDGQPWTTPDTFAPSRIAWAAYARHELLSIAFQGILWSALTAAEAAGRRRFRDAPDLAAFAVEQLERMLPREWSKTTFGVLVKKPLVANTSWSDDSHEAQAGWRIVAREATADSVAVDATSILAALVARASSPTEDPYARLHFEADYFERYPINLRSLFRRTHGEWSSVTISDAFRSWVVWSLRTHWRVALQKLAEATPRDTFKVRPLDGAIQIVEAPGPTFSAPRIHRVVGILHDLGIVEDDENERPVLTKEGEWLRGDLLG